ncbi:hypothetical protein COOONC_18034 [Cooperia oncophora]
MKQAQSVPFSDSPTKQRLSDLNEGTCPSVNVGPTLLNNLYKHVRNVHFWGEQEVARLQLSFKSSSRSTTEFPCGECGRIFHWKKRVGTTQQGKLRSIFTHSALVNQTSLQASNVHNVNTSGGHVACPVCEHTFTSNSLFAVHCPEKHSQEVPDQDFTVISGYLQNWETFQDWKHAKELAASTHFVIRNSFELPYRRTVKYVCQHARGTGRSVDVLALRKRYRIPRRIHSHCSAFLNASLLADGSVDYCGCFGHIGHVVTTATLPLPPEDKSIIIEMLKSGVPPL